MSYLEPLINAALAIQLHAFAALFALILGAVQLFLRKGTSRHRIFGYVWSAAMVLVAVSSFWIHEIRQWREFSIIHLISIYVLVGLPLAVLAARKKNVGNHAKSMQGLYIGGLIIAGLFTLSPGRILVLL